ncbi:MAG: DUF2796 domain-containing protein [Pseudomonadota bacterium]
MKLISAVLLFGLVFSGAVFAQGAHVHSTSNATLAIDQNQIEFNLQSPGANLVGFEHSPRDDVQTAMLEQAKATLQSGDWLGFAPRADCAIIELELETPGFEQRDEHDHHHEGHEHDNDHANHAHGEHEHHDEDHDHGDHSHADHHAHHDYEEHEHDDRHHHHEEDHAGHDHGDHNHEHHGHAEFHLRVQAECDNIEQLSWIEFALFEGWPDHREMQLDVLTDRIQQRFELSADNQRVELD